MAITVNIYYTGSNGGARREKYDLHMLVERYLSDETGVPAGDAAFIRSREGTAR